MTSPFVVVARDKDDACEVIEKRFGATTDEVVKYRRQWSDGDATAIGIDLNKHGIFSRLDFDWVSK